MERSARRVSGDPDDLRLNKGTREARGEEKEGLAESFLRRRLREQARPRTLNTFHRKDRHTLRLISYKISLICCFSVIL